MEKDPFLSRASTAEGRSEDTTVAAPAKRRTTSQRAVPDRMWHPSEGVTQRLDPALIVLYAYAITSYLFLHMRAGR